MIEGIVEIASEEIYPKKTTRPCGELFSFVVSFGASCEDGQVDGDSFVGDISERAIGCPTT